MVETQVEYENLVDRQAKVTQYQSQGLRLLHDNFSPDWEHGQEPYGTLVFTDEPVEHALVDPRIIELRAYLADLHTGLPEVEDGLKTLISLVLGD